jgi:hypothetical protein
MHMTALDIFLWVVGFLDDVILLGVLIAKHRGRRFPIFTSLIALYISRPIALSLVHRYGRDAAYYSAYWAPGIRRTFLWMIAAGVAVSAAPAWLFEPVKRIPLGAGTLRGNFSTSVLINKLFVGMIMLSVTTGLPSVPMSRESFRARERPLLSAS